MPFLDLSTSTERDTGRGRKEEREVTTPKHQQGDPGYPGAILRTLFYIPEVGRQGWMVECSICNEEFRVYEWSIAGTGRRCPGCGHLYQLDDVVPRNREEG